MEEVLDKFISADHVISILESVPQEEEEEDEQEEEEEDVEEEETEEVPKTKSGGRGDYDEKKILKQLLDGDKPKKVAEDHGVTVQTVYNLKARAKKGTETKQEPTIPKAVVTPAEKVRFLVEEGKTDEEIYGQMGNSMTSKQLREALEDAHERN